jgi:hypothetical protein
MHDGGGHATYICYLQLRMAALNSPQSGNMDGINGVNYAMYRELKTMLLLGRNELYLVKGGKT